VSAASDSIFRRNLRRFARDRGSLAWGIVFVAFLLAALLAPWLAPHDPAASSLLRRLQPPGWMEGGDWRYPLGCDALGRDVLSRVLHGARVSISIGVVVAALAACFGTAMGLLAGFAGGVVDAVISRIVDVLFAFPLLIFAIGLMGMMGPGLFNIVLALVLKDWVITCRLVRGQTLDVRDREYVEAAVAVGASRLHIMAQEILPNILSPVIVVATIRMATIIMVEASLSFLGIGVQPPTPAWGSMIADGRSFMVDAWWVSGVPGLAIFALVLAVNLTSQGLRDAFDPRLGR
jgi:ABC-type dipeptide/oligopeptide/nickel transport system permease subunit